MYKRQAYTSDDHGRPLPGVQARPAVMDDLPASAVLLASRDGGTASSGLSRLRIWTVAGHLLFWAVHQGKVVCYARLAWQTPGAIGGRNVPDGYYPVSYTHLDVYKRQAMDKQTEFVLRTMEERDIRFVRL